MAASFIEWFEIDKASSSPTLCSSSRCVRATGFVLGTLFGRCQPMSRWQFDGAGRARSDSPANAGGTAATFFSAVPAIYAMLNSAADEVHPDMS